MLVGRLMTPPVNIPRTRVIFCAGLSKRLVTSAVYFEIAILAESKFGKKK